MWQASEDLRLRVWDTRDLSQPAGVFEGAHNNVLTCCAVSADGQLFVSCSNGFDGQGCELKVWDRRQSKLLFDLSGHTQSVTCCGFVPGSPSAGHAGSSPLVVSGSQDATLRSWSIEGAEGSQVSCCRLETAHRLTSLAVAPAAGWGAAQGPGDTNPANPAEQPQLLTASFSGAVGWWEMAAGGSCKLRACASEGSLLSRGDHETPL